MWFEPQRNVQGHDLPNDALPTGLHTFPPILLLVSALMCGVLLPALRLSSSVRARTNVES